MSRPCAVNVSMNWTTLYAAETMTVKAAVPSYPHSEHSNRNDRRQCLTNLLQTIITRQVIWHDASRSQWQEYALEIGEILHIFPSGTQSTGERGSKKAYTGPRTGIYLPTKFGCDRSIVVGCRSRNDRQTDRQTEWNDNKAAFTHTRVRVRVRVDEYEKT